MASDAQETLYRIFAALSGSGGGLVSGWLSQGAVSAAGSGLAATPGAGGGAGSVALEVLTSGLGVVPLVTALLGLFGGGEDAAPAPPVKYALPPSIGFEAVETASGLGVADRDQFGALRPYGNAAPSAAPAPQVNVTVQAMDARSFLDRSSEIAAAVREAMLNLNSINDVVNDL